MAVKPGHDAEYRYVPCYPKIGKTMHRSSFCFTWNRSFADAKPAENFTQNLFDVDLADQAFKRADRAAQVFGQ